MTPLWDKTLEKYIRNLISPDGRNTFESTSALAQNILEKANIRDGDTVIDIGCGWGNITKQCAALTKGLVIGIEPNSDNIREALKKSESSNIQYVQGAFEQLNCEQEAEVVISSLAFHQVPYRSKGDALKNIGVILKKTGRFILCDTLILFDPNSNQELFDKVYRYLLAKTTPPDIYEKQIAPYLQNDHIYTWEDMKQYTPENNWFYSLDELTVWTAENGMAILEKEELCPFFGVITISHKNQL